MTHEEWEVLEGCVGKVDCERLRSICMTIDIDGHPWSMAMRVSLWREHAISQVARSHSISSNRHLADSIRRAIEEEAIRLMEIVEFASYNGAIEGPTGAKNSQLRAKAGDKGEV